MLRWIRPTGRSSGEAELAALAFPARYSGRTLDAYRHDLRNLFQWAAGHGLPVLEATRAHLEFYRASMEDRGLAASTTLAYFRPGRLRPQAPLGGTYPGRLSPPEARVV